jgi:hypothetical protein
MKGEKNVTNFANNFVFSVRKCFSRLFAEKIEQNFAQ